MPAAPMAVSLADEPLRFRPACRPAGAGAALMRTLYIAALPDLRLLAALRQAGHALQVLAPDEADWAIAESRHLLAVYDAETPDLLLLRRWRDLRPPHATLLLISGEHSPVSAAAALRAGADSYLPRPISLLELEARVQALLRQTRRRYREILGSDGEAARDTAALEIGGREHVIRYEGRQQVLPPREHALLILLAQAAGRAISRDVLGQHLWGDEAEPRPERVDLYASRLRRRLRALGAPHALEALRGFGYRLRGPVELH